MALSDVADLDRLTIERWAGSIADDDIETGVPDRQVADYHPSDDSGADDSNPHRSGFLLEMRGTVIGP